MTRRTTSRPTRSECWAQCPRPTSRWILPPANGPTVSLKDDADPAQMARPEAAHRASADTAWVGARAGMTEPEGENNIYPTVPKETLKAHVGRHQAAGGEAAARCIRARQARGRGCGRWRGRREMGGGNREGAAGQHRRRAREGGRRRREARRDRSAARASRAGCDRRTDRSSGPGTGRGGRGAHGME